LQIVTRTLDNGLRLVMVENHNAPVISLQMWYHVGSKDE
jgi:zinc protease